jgi:hypothetical protein
MIALSKYFDLLSLGDEEAKALGVNVPMVRFAAITPRDAGEFPLRRYGGDDRLGGAYHPSHHPYGIRSIASSPHPPLRRSRGRSFCSWPTPYRVWR